jgi:hypothetical protein
MDCGGLLSQKVFWAGKMAKIAAFWKFFAKKASKKLFAKVEKFFRRVFWHCSSSPSPYLVF